MKRYFVYTDEKSNKFWQIEITDNEFIVTYGKVNTAGQSKTKTFEDAIECKKEAGKLIKEKINKGYQEVENSSEKKSTLPSTKTDNSKGGTQLKQKLQKYYKRTFLEKLSSFYDTGLIAQYDKKYFTLHYGEPSKVKINFRDSYLTNIDEWMDDVGYGSDIEWRSEDEDLYPETIPFALLSTGEKNDEEEDYDDKDLLVVNTKNEKATVYLWTEFTFFVLFDSLDEFLQAVGDKNKNEKDPFDILKKAISETNKLNDKKKYKESIDILVPALQPFENFKKEKTLRSFHMHQFLEAAYLLAGISYYQQRDFSNAETNYLKSFQLGQRTAGENLIVLYFENYKDYQKTIDLCDKLYQIAFKEDKLFCYKYKLLSYFMLKDKKGIKNTYADLEEYYNNKSWRKNNFDQILKELSQQIKKFIAENENIEPVIKKEMEEFDNRINSSI